jgi:hypothetical protein
MNVRPKKRKIDQGNVGRIFINTYNVFQLHLNFNDFSEDGLTSENQILIKQFLHGYNFSIQDFPIMSLFSGNILNLSKAISIFYFTSSLIHFFLIIAGFEYVATILKLIIAPNAFHLKMDASPKKANPLFLS